MPGGWLAARRMETQASGCGQVLAEARYCARTAGLPVMVARAATMSCSSTAARVLLAGSAVSAAEGGVAASHSQQTAPVSTAAAAAGQRPGKTGNGSGRWRGVGCAAAKSRVKTETNGATLLGSGFMSGS